MMRLLFAVLIICLSLIPGANALLALGMQENQVQGANYLLTQNRYAATGTIDGAYYNPAGLVKLKDGLYVSVGNITNLGAVKQDSQLKDYNGDIVYFTPQIYAVYKSEDLVFYYAGSLPQEGGYLKYNDGSLYNGQLRNKFEGYLAVTPIEYTDDNSEIFNLVIGNSIGFAYRVDDSLSFSLGFRFVYAQRSYKSYIRFLDSGSVPYEDEEYWRDEAHGFTPLAGINFTVFDDLTVSLNFHGVTYLDFEINSEDSVLEDYNLSTNYLYQLSGTTEERNIPGQIGIGVSYRLFELLSVEIDATYYFDYENIVEFGENPYDIGIGVEFELFPEFLVIGGGFKMLNVQNNASSYRDVDQIMDDPYMDYIAFSGGIRLFLEEALVVTLGCLKPFYEDYKFSDITVSKDTILFGGGVQYQLTY